MLIFSCGIRNCHETTNLAEGQEKLAKGMQVLIREGSAAKDLGALAPLIVQQQQIGQVNRGR